MCLALVQILFLSPADSQSEHICEDQPFSGGNGGGQSGSLSDEHNTVARSLVVGEELMVSGLVTRPMVTGLEPAEVLAEPWVLGDDAE